MDNYLSLITNFGCHYKCPYCVVKQNKMQVPKTTIKGLKNLSKEIQESGCEILSISGGGDPLYEYSSHLNYYKELLSILGKEKMPFEMHTSYLSSDFPIEKTLRTVYHLRTLEQLQEVKRVGNEIVRIVFVVTKDFTEEKIKQIAAFVKESQVIDELSFRQLIKQNFEIGYFMHSYLQKGHQKDWWYIEHTDYHHYYAEGKIYECFEKISI